MLTKFSKKMGRSGYHQGYREEVIKSGVLGFERQLAASRSGEKPLFRPRDWQKVERRRTKMVRKAAWYRPADCIGFYPPSPRGELAKEIGEVLMEEGRRINFNLRAIETGGLSIVVSHVVDQAVCLTCAVEEQVGLTTFPQLCTEELANFVEKWRCRLNTGEKLPFVAPTGRDSTMRMSRERRSQMHSTFADIPSRERGRN